MSKSITLSIIIPVYKVLADGKEVYFKDLLKSIAKNLHSDILQLEEIIILDDSYEEGNLQEIESIFQSVGLLKYLRYEKNDFNIGQAASRNRGLKLATSEYIHFIDQDDYISESFYGNALAHSGSDLIICNVRHYFSDERKLFNPIKGYYLKLLGSVKYVSQLKVLLLVNIAFSPGQYLVKRSVCDRLGGFPDLKNKGTDDYGILYKMAFYDKVSIRLSEDSIFYYRKHYSQSRRNLNMRKSHLEFFNTIPNGYRGIIWHIKTSSILSYFFTRMAYLIFFNRAQY